MYRCRSPEIDSSTQAAVDCSKNHTVEGDLIFTMQSQLSACMQTVFSDQHNLNLHNEAMTAYLNSQMERK